MITLLIVIFIISIYTRPYLDIFEDYRGEHHIILWYNNFKGERKYINIRGSQQ